MSKFSDYNMISIGDHCAVPMILKELNVRKKSYPFDWNASSIDLLYDTNIMKNVSFIDELVKTENIDELVQKYIGDAFDNQGVNTIMKISFPHDVGSKLEIFEKYKRRFDRLKEDLPKKNLFILLTRHYFIEKEVFDKIKEQLLSYNNVSMILFISGTNHEYIEDDKVIFKHINYDVSKFYQYDYTYFRPQIKEYLYKLL